MMITVNELIVEFENKLNRELLKEEIAIIKEMVKKHQPCRASA
ncbi:hypothetical protein [Halalkalibacter akibai]|nr:hypothetical protein [Halalkalibacter akibai]